MGCIANHRVVACVKMILWAVLTHFVNGHLGDIFGKNLRHRPHWGHLPQIICNVVHTVSLN